MMPESAFTNEKTKKQESQILSAADLYQHANSHFNAGDYPSAIRFLRSLLQHKDYVVKANTNLGSCLLMMGLPKPAMKYINRALAIEPGFLPARLNQVKALIAQKRHDEASLKSERIVQEFPSEQEGWSHYVSCLRARDLNDEALEATRRWLKQLPLSLEGHLQEGELLSNRGDHQQAVQSLGKALKIKPDSEKVYSHLSVVMIRLRSYEPALEYINKSLAFDPESLIYICRKGSVLRLLGSWREAAACYRKASQLHPDSAIFHLNQYLMLPGIPISREEIQESRARFIEGLSIAEANPSLTPDFINEAVQHTFELAYHNQEDRYLLERYINLMRKLCQPILETCNARKLITNRRPRSAKESRLRIGLLSRFFSGHSNTIAFSGLIRHLSREKFEVILIHAANSKKDQARDALDAECDATVQLPDDYADACERLYALNLDILYFTDLGMNPNDFILPLLCTAPIQITGWGIPHTSGIREISYYVSVSGLEPDGAEELYTEKLVKLPGRLPCIFETIGMSFTPLPREYFFLPPDATCIGCLQGLHKLHPDFDDILEQIAIQNPEAIFVFIEDSIPSRTHLFLNRLESSAPSVRQRCLTLAMMARSEYHALCNCIDVLLDPIYYGCGITFFEACFVGTPVVTLEGTNLRSRVVANGYREMEIKDMPVVQTVEEYVNLVSNLCRNAARRERLKASILKNNHRVFNRIDYVRDFEKFCIEAVRPPSRDHHLSQGIT